MRFVLAVTPAARSDDVARAAAHQPAGVEDDLAHVVAEVAAVGLPDLDRPERGAREPEQLGDDFMAQIALIRTVRGEQHENRAPVGRRVADQHLADVAERVQHDRVGRGGREPGQGPVEVGSGAAELRDLDGRSVERRQGDAAVRAVAADRADELDEGLTDVERRVGRIQAEPVGHDHERQRLDRGRGARRAPGACRPAATPKSAAVRPATGLPSASMTVT